jgi:hypothetical protein
MKRITPFFLLLFSSYSVVYQEKIGSVGQNYKVTKAQVSLRKSNKSF